MNTLISIILFILVDISGISLGFVIGYIVGKKKHTQIQKGGDNSIQIQNGK